MKFPTDVFRWHIELQLLLQVQTLAHSPVYCSNFYHLTLVAYDVRMRFESRICIFNSRTFRIKRIMTFERNPWPFEVASSVDKVLNYLCICFYFFHQLSSIHYDTANYGDNGLFEIFDLVAQGIHIGQYSFKKSCNWQ